MLNSEQSGHGLSVRKDPANRFVAFTFAASEMVLEVDGAGRITYAAGAFRSRLGSSPDSFLGRHLADLVAPSHREALQMALILVQERGRLLPCMVRLSNADRTPAVLSGLKLSPQDPASPLCLTLGHPPADTGLVTQATTAQHLLKAAQARMAPSDTDQMPEAGQVALLEIAGDRSDGQALATVLEVIAPNTLASEVAPGRYGLLNTAGQDIATLLPLLEAELQREDRGIAVLARQISLASHGLTAPQAAAALRQALATFAREGLAGIDGAGFNGGLAGYVRNAMLQVQALRSSIARRDFSIVYQPIVSLATRKLHHYEALLRPRHDMVIHSPQEFVLLVETVGLADELDIAVAGIVCEAAQRSAAPLAFNLSGHSAQNPAFRTRLIDLLDRSQAARTGRILVEMTETAAIDDVSEVVETARAIRAAGVHFCLDDFGAGASDIRLLRATPTDIVKLDGSFVPGITSGGRERAFVTGMVEIARAAGAEVVAERIETEAEAKALAEIGAGYGQGWLFGRPAPLPEPPTSRPARRNGSRESWS